MNEVWDQIVRVVTEYGVDVVAGVVILLVGLYAAGWARRVTVRLLSRVERIDPMLRGFLASFARYGVIVVVALTVLDRFGVETTSIIAVLGALGLAVGLAMQGVLGDVAAGVMLLIIRPFKVGDYVEVAGLAGTVANVTLFATEFDTPDNVRIVAPNGKVWGQPVKNYSHHEMRRMDLEIGVPYDSDIDAAMAAIAAAARADARVSADPPATLSVSALRGAAAVVTLRLWCKRADSWALKCDLTKAMKHRLDAERISIS